MRLELRRHRLTLMPTALVVIGLGFSAKRNPDAEDADEGTIVQ